MLSTVFFEFASLKNLGLELNRDLEELRVYLLLAEKTNREDFDSFKLLKRCLALSK